MGTEIKDMLDSVAGVRKDWREDWREDAREDWRFDFDSVPGDLAGAAPVNTVLPAISGTILVGETLSVTTGTWTGNPAPTYTYQWRVDGSDVVGATTNSYVLQAADEGFMVDCRVTATNSEGSANVLATSVGPIEAAPANLTLPVISGTLNVGDTLTVTDGTWSGVPTPTITYQWRVDGSDVMGATTNSYVLQAGDATFMVDCRVTATNTRGSDNVLAAAVGPVV